jgi:DNA-binding response OmpR family regulator
VSKRKLLLADDSITIQKVVNLTFADEGIEVISVGDGDSALRKFDEFMPDLVMADVNMPGKNGYEVCRLIKRTEETRNIPVILLVGSFEPFDEAEAKDAGADDFLTKPFQSIRQLVNKVTELLNQTAPRDAEKPAVDSFADTLKLANRDEASDEFEQREESPSEFERPQEVSNEFTVPPIAPTEFGDAGMDDEMIEMSPATEYVSDSGSQNETPLDYGKTQPLNADELKSFDIAGRENNEQEPPPETSKRAEPATFAEEALKLDENDYEEAEENAPVVSETEPQIDYYLPGEPEFDARVSDAETLEPEVSYENETPRTPDFSQAPDENQAESESLTEESGETVEESSETSLAEETRRREVSEGANATPEAGIDLSQVGETVEEPAPNQETESDSTTAATEAEPPAETEEPREFEWVAETPISTAASSPTLSFDDGDLLELPPLVEETGIRPQPKVEPVKSEPAAVEAPAEPEPETTEAEPPAQTAESAAMQAFPPELIEAIAQRVAEKISAKTMNDVLPQITELVMKKMAEENQENKK